MALGMVPSDAAILLVQAGCVAAPRAMKPELTQRLRRLRGRWWALIPAASIIGVIFMIQFSSGTAQWLTYLALVAVPILAFGALAWGVRGPGGHSLIGIRPLIALAITAGMFMLAWRDQYTLLGEGAATLLSALSCVSLGILLATVCPGGWLKVGLIAVSCADEWLIATTTLQAPNGQLVAAAPGAHLPQLQSESFGAMNMGYEDLFVAGVLGGVLAAERVSSRYQMGAALLTLTIAGLFDLFFFAFQELPATVPIALTVIVLEIHARIRRRGESLQTGRSRRFPASLTFSPRTIKE